MKECFLWEKKDWLEFYCPADDKVLTTVWLRTAERVLFQNSKFPHSWDISLGSGRAWFKCVMQTIHFTGFDSSKQVTDKETQPNQPISCWPGTRHGMWDNKVQGPITCPTERKGIKHCAFTTQGVGLLWSRELQTLKADVPPGHQVCQISEFNICLKLLDTDLPRHPKGHRTDIHILCHRC